MKRNRGRTTLRSRRRNEDPMREFDRLPPMLREWLAGAVLPWRPRSVLTAFERARAKSQDPQRALAELDRIQSRLVAKDAARIWGQGHPGTGSETSR